MLPPILPDPFVLTEKMLYKSAPWRLQNDGTGERGWDAGAEGDSSAGSNEEGPARGHRYDPFAEEEARKQL
jgi:hypothetical protein